MPFYHYEDIPKIQSDTFRIIEQLDAHLAHLGPVVPTAQSSRLDNPILLARDILAHHARILFSTISAWHEDELPADRAYHIALEHYSLTENTIAIIATFIFYVARTIPDAEINLNLSASETLLYSLKRKMRTVLNRIYAANYINPKEAQ